MATAQAAASRSVAYSMPIGCTKRSLAGTGTAATASSEVTGARAETSGPVHGHFPLPPRASGLFEGGFGGPFSTMVLIR